MKVRLNARNRGYTFDCEEGEKILFAGLRHGLDLPYECGTGTCGTCKARLVSGEVDDGWPEAVGRRYLHPGHGHILLCQCAAVTDCTVEVASFVHESNPGAYVPRTFAGEISTWKMLTRDVALWELELDNPLEFDAGQYVLVGLPRIRGYRAYSMVNFTHAPRRLVFVIKNKPGGAFSEALFGSSPVGTPVTVIGPLGRSTFYPGLSKNVLCIAGGTGIAGIMSILSRAAQERYFDRYEGYVFFGVRTMQDAFFLDELERFSEAFRRGLEVTIALSEADVPARTMTDYPNLQFEKGLVHDVAVRQMGGKLQNVKAFLAGPPAAVDAAIRALILDAKLTADQIVYDKFR